MRSRTRLRTTHTVIALCSLVLVSFILVSSLGAPSVQAGVTPTSTSPPPTPTDEPDPSETPEPTEKKKTPPPRTPTTTPTPYPTPPPPPTYTPAPAPEVTPMRIFAPKTGGGDGASLPFGVWQIGLGLVFIGIAVAWSRHRRAG